MTKYKKAERMQANIMARALDEYVALSTFYLRRGRPEEVCYQASELLHELGEDEFPSDEELKENGDATKNVIKGLRQIVLAKERLPGSVRGIRAQHKRVMENLDEFRQMLKSAYSDKE